MGKRFTIDGSNELECRLECTCAQVLQGVLRSIPERRLEALVLGGGYGRGHGGVLRTTNGDAPYNDLEFYAFLRGNRLLNARRYRSKLDELGEALSPRAGLHVEFKIESLARFQQSTISMFSYDLVVGHRVVFGRSGVFRGCEHHLRPALIPISEATRLLFNRCTGLLLAREMFVSGWIDEERFDFIRRNIAKCQLALGDALLTALGLYDWDARERHRRLLSLSPNSCCSLDLGAIQSQHAEGLAFKLHPVRALMATEALRQKHDEVAQLARSVWLWVEGLRLNCEFKSAEDYVASSLAKWDGSPWWLNYLLNVRTFGVKAVFDSAATRYPRARLLTALPVLLWADTTRPAKNIQAILHAPGADWRDLVSAYKEVWPSYG